MKSKSHVTYQSITAKSHKSHDEDKFRAMSFLQLSHVSLSVSLLLYLSTKSDHPKHKYYGFPYRLHILEPNQSNIEVSNKHTIGWLKVDRENNKNGDCKSTRARSNIVLCVLDHHRSDIVCTGTIIVSISFN